MTLSGCISNYTQKTGPKALKSKMFVNLGSQSLGYSLYQIIITISSFVSDTEFQCMIYIYMPKNEIFNLLQFLDTKIDKKHNA